MSYDILRKKNSMRRLVHVMAMISLIMNHPEQNKGISEIEIHRLTYWDKLKVAALSAQVSELTMASAEVISVAKSNKKKKKVTHDSQVERSDSNRTNGALMYQKVADSDTDSD